MTVTVDENIGETGYVSYFICYTAIQTDVLAEKKAYDQ